MGTDPPRTLDVSHNGPEELHNLEDYLLVLKKQPTTNGEKLQHMMLNMSSSSPIVSTLADLKAGMTAVAAGLSYRRGPKKKKNTITSIVFNSMNRRPGIQRSVKEQIITLNLSRIATSLSTSITVPTYISSSFTLNSFNDYSSYTSLFDQYKFNEIEVWIEPTLSSSTAVANIGNYCTAIDYDDANTPTSIDNVEGHQGSLISTGFASHYHRWVPGMAIAAYSGAFSSFSSSKPTWIDSASPGVQHYGFKFAAAVTSSVIVYTMTFKASVSFKNPFV